MRRDAEPNPVCSCDHSRCQHRIDLKRQSCEVGGCPCTSYVHRWNDWTVRGVEREEVA